VLSTTTTSTTQLRTAIPFAGLALTIQDAIGVTYKLGSRYIWIDSLCVLQDDAQDWEREAKNMCTVYRNATLTIAALGAAHAAEGLFSRRNPLVLAGCRVPSSRQIRVPEPLPDMAYWSLYLDKSALQTRGCGPSRRLMLVPALITMRQHGRGSVRKAQCVIYTPSSNQDKVRRHGTA
jgi:hypothetical protein